MPILAIWCSLCPKNLEATSITLFTGILNLSGNVSNYFGVFVMWAFGVSQDNLDKVWLLLGVQNVYLFFVISAIILVKLPNPLEKQIEKESEEHRLEI